YLAPEQYAAIRRLCSDRSCPILLDEVFHDYPAHGLRASSSDEASGLTVRLSGLSKVVGAPQLKLGWIRLGGDAAQARAAAARLEFIADAYLSASTPAQLATESLLPARGPIQARILERLEANERAAEQALGSESRARLLPRQGGWYLVLRLPEGEDEEELAHQLLVDDHVVVHPGYFYDFPEGEHLVLSLISPPEGFAEGVSRVARRIGTRASG
ncbi:MAG: aminotransferase class I/II-fold pyridoxal phosphate-dependent enzyme, partial [Chloroflexi bacterium]|nr:aminotransferase class I/II-fold pyridoxal phosphate-dependent enzyme [Chloroflexota bacterium]